MKRVVLSLGCLVGVLVLGVNADASAADAGNPYAGTIVGRNVFSLKSPPPPPKPEDLIKKDPPPKILLQGLTTILGRRQVLFKVQVPARPGQAAKEESYVLAEGERHGEIEVLQIDENAGVVKFNNHGTEEPLNMKEHVAKATAAPPAAMPQPGLPTPLPGIPRPTAAVNPSPSGPSVVTTFGGSSSRAIPTTRDLRTPTAAGEGAPVGFDSGQTPQSAPTTRPLSREEQIIMMEVLREQHRDNPKFPPMPPTALTPTPSTPPSTPQ